MLKTYFKSLYQRTMHEAYGLAAREIVATLTDGGECLDCGAGDGYWLSRLKGEIDLSDERYCGIEWEPAAAERAQVRGIHVVQGDLNRGIPFGEGRFSCVFALSVLEHLLNP